MSVLSESSAGEVLVFGRCRRHPHRHRRRRHRWRLSFGSQGLQKQILSRPFNKLSDKKIDADAANKESGNDLKAAKDEKDDVDENVLFLVRKFESKVKKM